MLTPSQMKLVGQAGCTAVRSRSVENMLSHLGGVFHSELWRPRKSGTLHLFEKYTAKNDITNVGKNKILDVMFNDATPIANASWFGGLISLASYSALAAGDTMASHAGWLEFISYSQSTRVAWGSGAASSQSITNASAMVFDITGSGTVKGVFINSVSTKSGTLGTLWATALYSGDVAVLNGDQIRSTYTLGA